MVFVVKRVFSKIIIHYNYDCKDSPKYTKIKKYDRI